MHQVQDSVCHLFDKQRQAYIAKKTKLFAEYMQTLSKNCEQNFLISFTGWDDDLVQNLAFTSPQTKQEGGYFFRYSESGVCLNPGRDFFKRAFSASLHLWHIDTVIVTQNDRRCFDNLELIYELNRELNQTLLSHDQEPHVIQYLLHPEVYAAFSPRLRPYFRQERESVICLESFDVSESLQISDAIELKYRKESSGLQCIFQLQNGLAFGYCHNSRDFSFFTPCKMLVTSYQEIMDLASLCKLELLLLSEFGISEGDIRLEAVKECRLQAPSITTLPFDSELTVSLEHLAIKESISNDLLVPHSSIQVVRKQDFEKLLYLCQDQTA